MNRFFMCFCEVDFMCLWNWCWFCPYSLRSSSSEGWIPLLQQTVQSNVLSPPTDLRIAFSIKPGTQEKLHVLEAKTKSDHTFKQVTISVYPPLSLSLSLSISLCHAVRNWYRADYYLNCFNKLSMKSILFSLGSMPTERYVFVFILFSLWFNFNTQLSSFAKSWFLLFMNIYTTLHAYHLFDEKPQWNFSSSAYIMVTRLKYLYKDQLSLIHLLAGLQ